MRHLVIGLCQKAPNFSAFHWSPYCCLVTIGQHFITTRVVHLPKRTETSLITESDQSRANHQLLQLCTVHTAWSDSDQAVRAVHSCKSWFWLRFPWDIISQNLSYLLHFRGKLKYVLSIKNWPFAWNLSSHLTYLVRFLEKSWKSLTILPENIPCT